jgi:predicted kinase
MENRITITVGISNSGKSTWAHEQWNKDPKNIVLVNRDNIRALLFGYNDSNIKEYYKRDDIFSLEKQVTRYEDTIINEALEAGKNVIVDATHLKREYLERFKYWNVSVGIETFNISPLEAIIRDMKRSRQVGDEIILKQYSQLKNLEKGLVTKPIDFTPTVIKTNRNLPPAIIFDIDGTLAHMKGRSPYDWKKVGGDTVDLATDYIATCLGDLGDSAPTVIICTGRDGIAKYETEKWLKRNNIFYDDIYIRETKDSRPDWVVKEEMWRDIAKEYHIIGMFDDRLQVVRRARALGLKVFNVEYNNF